MRKLLIALASLAAVVSAGAAAQTSQFVYTAGTPYGGTSETLIHGFSINGASGALTAIANSPYSAGGSIQEMVAHPSGSFVYAATTAGIAAFSVDALSGGLTPVTGSPFGTAPSTSYPDGAPAYPLLAMDPSGKFLYVANQTSSQIQEFSVNATTGALAQISQTSASGVYALAEGPHGGYLYASAYSGTAVYSIDPTSGNLTLLQTASGCSSSGPIVIDSSGLFLYGLASGIAACQISPSSGMLSPVSGSPFATAGLEYLATDPSGAFLYGVTAGPVSGNPARYVYGFTIDAATGALTAMQNSPFALPNENGNYTYVSGVSVEPRGKYAYVAEGNYGVASYSINQTTGQLSLVSSSFQGPNAEMVVSVGSQTLWDPGVSWSTPAAITYGTALSGTQLDATAEVAGTFSYSPMAGTVLGAGSQSLSVNFTPTDTADYTSASAQVTLTVNQATPTVTWASPSAITYGTALSSAQLNATASVPGTFTYSSPNGTILTAGSHSITVTFTPTDTTDYTTATDTIYLTVNQATPTITWSTPTAITYGTAVSGTQLNATASVPGTFYYSTATGSILTAGAHTITASFYPSDSTDYAYTSANVSLTVNKATPTVAWTSPGAITYGTALSSTQLDARATGSGIYASTAVSGSYVYSPAAGTVLGVGSQTLSTTFTPADTTDYTTATASTTLTVNQATPAITWATPAAISYGTAVGASQLDATSPVAGSFTYLPASGTVLGAGSQTLKATFTPTDTTDYTTAMATVTLTVNQATPAITWATPTAITYGTALGASQLDATSPVAGSFNYSPASGTVLGAGPQMLTATFTPTDTTDYKTATASVTLTVNKATPAITWATPTPITYGTALGSGQLDATSSVAGSFTYSPASGTVLGAGPQTLTATLTPTDTTDYTTATANVSLTVNQAATTIAWSTPAAITYGTALGTTQLNATASVPGSYVYNPAAGTVLTAGSHTLTATFTPSDTTDYTTASATVQLTVNQATPTITWATPSAIVFGTALSSAQLDATASVPGSFVYSPASGTVPAVGSDTLSVTFTPTDATDYTTATAKVTLAVNEPVPAISSLSPVEASAGGAGFTLTVNGTGFNSATTAFWGSTALMIQSASATQLTVLVPASAITTAGTDSVTVQNPTPGGGASNPFQFAVVSASSGTPPSFTTLTASVAPGSTASYPVTLSSSATNVSVTCLNLPAGASCTYSASTGAVTIATTSTTPAGSYQITVIFTETVPSTSISMPLVFLLLLPLMFIRRRLQKNHLWLMVCLGIAITIGTLVTGCGGSSGSGGGSGGGSTIQVTTAAPVTLTVQ